MFITSAFDDEPRHGGYELAVRLACVWYIYDAEKLWSKVPETANYTLTNWQRWKRVLEEAGESFGDQALKSVIERALSEIRRVESD